MTAAGIEMLFEALCPMLEQLGTLEKKLDRALWTRAKYG